MINSEKVSTNVNFTQVCHDCKSYYQTFKIDIDKYYDEGGKSVIETKELYEKFSFICKKCGLLNILNFNEICNKETVFFFKKKQIKILVIINSIYNVY